MSPPFGLAPAPPAPRAVGLEAIYGWLMSGRQGYANDDALARMLVSQLLGEGSLPVGLGLSPDAYAELKARHFPGSVLPPIRRPPPVWDARLLEEKDELIALLDEHRAGQDRSESWLSVIVATGCLANDHLWQDLGLWSRRDLSELMARNFPALAARNDRDMKWKKFLYKQLCEREGVYLCRAPSCAVCCDYAKCFGSED
ncbi:MAG: nitrogen fixation protein NifQ [Candidatus Competibacteraceae bacterium]|nr:nitrogen fixation protein NifQ [Candidatus Competibacteraceae bacterium]